MQRTQWPRDEVVLPLSGAIDIAVTPGLRRTVLDGCPAPGETRLVLDLSAVTLLDASALSLIVAAAHRYREVELRNPSRLAHTVLAIADLPDRVRIR